MTRQDAITRATARTVAICKHSHRLAVLYTDVCLRSQELKAAVCYIGVFEFWTGNGEAHNGSSRGICSKRCLNTAPGNALTKHACMHANAKASHPLLEEDRGAHFHPELFEEIRGHWILVPHYGWLFLDLYTKKSGASQRYSGLADQLRELIQINIAAGDDCHDFSRAGAVRAGSGHSTCRCALHDDAIPFRYEFHSLNCVIEGHC